MSDERRIIAELIDVSPELTVELLTEAEALELGIHPVAYRGEAGKSPRIGEDDYWYVWDNGGERWINTGVYARGGVGGYADLPDKPRINGVELVGDKTARQLGLENRIANSDIEALFME